MPRKAGWSHVSDEIRQPVSLLSSQLHERLDAKISMQGEQRLLQKGGPTKGFWRRIFQDQDLLVILM